MTHKGVDATSQVPGQWQWVWNMLIQLSIHMEYVKRPWQRLGRWSGYGKGSGREFPKSRKGTVTSLSEYFLEVCGYPDIE